MSALDQVRLLKEAAQKEKEAQEAQAKADIAKRVEMFKPIRDVLVDLKDVVVYPPNKYVKGDTGRTVGAPTGDVYEYGFYYSTYPHTCVVGVDKDFRYHYDARNDPRSYYDTPQPVIDRILRLVAQFGVLPEPKPPSPYACVTLDDYWEGLWGERDDEGLTNDLIEIVTQHYGIIDGIESKDDGWEVEFRIPMRAAIKAGYATWRQLADLYDKETADRLLRAYNKELGI
jgi:hypothetical protein